MLAFFRRIALPLIVLVIGIGGTLLAGHIYGLSVRDEGLYRQREQAGAYLRNLELGLASITDFNEGLAAHVTTSQPLDRRAFDEYIAMREAFSPQPALQSVAYLTDRHAGHRQAPIPKVGAGRHPGTGSVDRIQARRLVHSVSTGAAVDLAIPASRAAMRDAAGSGATIAVPYSDASGTTMLAVFTPVYAPMASSRSKEDGHGVVGFVRSTFALDGAVRSALGRPFDRRLDLEIHDAGLGGKLVYDDDGVPRTRQRESQIAAFDVGFAGRRWKAEFFHKLAGPSAWEAGEGLVLLSGLLLSGLLALATHQAVLRVRRPYIHSVFARNLHKAFEHHPFAVYYLDLQRRFVNVNEKTLAEFGLSRDQLLGTRSEALIAPEFRDLGRRHWEAALQGTAASYDTVLQAPDGRRFDVNVVLVPVMSGGVVAGVLGIVENITERKRDAEALQRSRRTLQSIVDNLPQEVFWKDTERRVVGCNRNFARFLGLDEMHVIGCTDEELCARQAQIDPARIDEYREEDRRVLERGEAVVGTEMLVRRRDGSTLWARTSKLPLRDADGRVTGLLGVSEDITERKLNELKLEQLANHDGLTGLPNRAFFLLQLERALAGAPEHLAVVYFDIDRFKSINDSWGHDIGDQVIRAFARRTRRLLRPTDVLGRLGGDEFVFFSEGLSHRAVESICERLVAAVRRPIRVDRNRVLQISTSVGVAFHRPDMTADELLREADQAMYRVKASGRDGLHVAQG